MNPDFQTDNKFTRDFYNARFLSHGIAPQSLAWSGETTQYLRFSILASIADLQGCRILDIGCGLGDFYLWLRGRGITVHYTGIDMSPDFIRASKERFGDAHFLEMDFMGDPFPGIGDFDYVFASGIFFLRKTEPMKYMELAVERMFSLAKKGVAFNSLSTWGDLHGQDDFEADPLEVLGFCRKLARQLAFRHDYHARDFSIFLYRS